MIERNDSVYRVRMDLDKNSYDPITPYHIKTVLLALLHGRPIPAANPLQYLTIVEQMLSDTELPLCENSRTVILGDILTSLIRNELVTHRQSMGVRNTSQETSLKKALQSITRDARTANRELLGWSWLFYHYVRVDLSIHAKDFCQVSHIDERTLRRYQASNFYRLSNILIKQERLLMQSLRVLRDMENHQPRADMLASIFPAPFI